MERYVYIGNCHLRQCKDLAPPSSDLETDTEVTCTRI